MSKPIHGTERLPNENEMVQVWSGKAWLPTRNAIKSDWWKPMDREPPPPKPPKCVVASTCVEKADSEGNGTVGVTVHCQCGVWCDDVTVGCGALWKEPPPKPKRRWFRHSKNPAGPQWFKIDRGSPGRGSTEEIYMQILPGDPDWDELLEAIDRFDTSETVAGNLKRIKEVRNRNETRNCSR